LWKQTGKNPSQHGTIRLGGSFYGWSAIQNWTMLKMLMMPMLYCIVV